MESSQIEGLSVFADGVLPGEISAGKRINANHRAPVQAAVDASTGEVRCHIDSEAVEILSRDRDGR